MTFNPLRLGIARKRRLLNKTDLAKLAGVTLHTVTRCEQGDNIPTQENVSAFARALKFPESFFFGQNVDWPNSEVTSFRSQRAMTAGVRDAALAAGSIGFLISDWVDEKFNLPSPSVPDLHLYNEKPESAALTLRQEWGLGEKPVSNMIQLLESKGIRVFSLAENTATVNAYSLWRVGKAFVFLNTFKSAESSRFDAAHELAHLVLHQDGSVTGRLAEEQANRFASAFLMPRADVLGMISSINHVEQLIRAKARWKVSVAALNYRLHKIGLTTEWRYRDLCIEIAKRGYNSHEPAAIPREVSIVWKKVLNALWSEGTSHEQIANELSIPEPELATLLFGILTPEALQRSDIQQPLTLL